MLPRTLEPELMDTPAEAREYDAMDHAAVNAAFVGDLLRTLLDWSLQWPVQTGTTKPGAWGRANASPQNPTLTVVDLGAGTAQIPIELIRRTTNLRITAVDAAASMLELAHANIAAVDLTAHVELVLADAKRLPFADAAYDVVISNSILHHIPDPQTVVAEAIRVTAPGGLLFHRDLARPNDEVTRQKLVATYAAEATPYQRKLFAESLYAALTVEEMRDLVTGFGFAPDTIQMTSDRHWTWVANN